MRLMLTCLCDAFYGEVGIATVRTLEYAGCKVEFPENQTCCGQPPFNAGAWDEARVVAQHCATTLLGKGTVVAPSSSCAAMVRHGYAMLGVAHDGKCFELCEFLVHELGMEVWPATRPYNKKVVIHEACHNRVLGRSGESSNLIRSIPGITVLPLEHEEQCCGFGGSFSATQGRLSSSIGFEKLIRCLNSGAEEIVSTDMGCLMHLNGLISRHELPIKTKHIAQILEAVIDG